MELSIHSIRFKPSRLEELVCSFTVGDAHGYIIKALWALGFHLSINHGFHPWLILFKPHQLAGRPSGLRIFPTYSLGVAHGYIIKALRA